MKTKVGFLIDLNSFPQFGKEEDQFNDENSPMMEDVFSTSGSSAAELCPMDSRLEAKIEQLKEFTLEQLTKEATIRGEFTPLDCQFTYRYYNSANYVYPIKELRAFVPFDSMSFDIFEKSLETEVGDVHGSAMEICQDTNRMSLMSSAFKGMISDFEWDCTAKDPTPFSRNPCSSGASVKSYSSSCDSISPDSTGESNRNIIYVFFRVPRNEDEMQEFVGDVPDKLDIATSSKHFLDSFIPKAFQEMITQSYQMRVNFVDMWSLHDKNYEAETLSSTIYPNSILKVLRHLHGGQILHPTSKMTMVPGLPRWHVFLKNNLKAHCPRVSIASRGSDNSGTTQMSHSSRCSTPVHPRIPNKLQAMKNPGQGSGQKTDSDSKNLTDRIRLWKGDLLNSQSQKSLSSRSLSGSGSQTSLSSFRGGSSRHHRFGSKSNQTILMPESTRPVILPLLRDSLDLLGYKSTYAGLDAHSSTGPNPKKVRRNLFVNSPEPKF